MNVPMIAMITQIPVVLSVTISIAVFVKTITHSNHLLKLEIMIAASWLLAVSVCVCHTLYGNHGCSRRPPPAASLQKGLQYQETKNNPVFLAWLHFYNPTLSVCVPIPYLSLQITSVVSCRGDVAPWLTH